MSVRERIIIAAIIAASWTSCIEPEKSTGGGGGNAHVQTFEIPFSQNFYLQEKLGAMREKAATLTLNISSSVPVASVYISRPGGELIAGNLKYSPAGEIIGITEGQPFVSFNAMLSDGPAQGDGTRLEVPALICPGSYPDGLELRICDLEHGVMNLTLPAFTIAAGETKTETINYSRDEGVVFFDGFDLCVWGGRPDAPEGAGFRSAMARNPGTIAYAALTGFENAVYSVPADYPGTGLFQTEAWSEVSGTTLDSCHSMSDSFIRSRNFNDYTYLYRAQEYQGCVGVSMETDNRGSFRTGPMRNMPFLGSAVLEFDIFAKAGYADSFEARVIDGGYIASATIDGEPFALTAENNNYYSATTATLTFPNDKMSPGGRWIRFSLGLEHVSDLSSFQFCPTSTSQITHGFLIDNLTVTAGRPVTKPEAGFRLIYWYIQDGMWADQENNYDNFVAWVRKFDPDVCVWCEGATLYADRTDDYIGAANRYLPDHWPELAARYGHEYTSVGAYVNGYPQIMTSKSPITTLQRIGIPPGETQRIRSGSNMFSVNLNGRTVTFVSLHLYPQKYRPDCPEEDKEASSAAREGEQFKAWEMDKILSLTVENPEYAGISDWVMCGDFNSRAPVDNFYYGLPEDDIAFLPHKYLAERTNFVDLIAARYPSGWFFLSNRSTRRIDFVYGSAPMAASVSDAMIVIDAWAHPAVSPYSPEGRHTPSDHRPILVDFAPVRTQATIPDLKDIPIELQ